MHQIRPLLVDQNWRLNLFQKILCRNYKLKLYCQSLPLSRFVTLTEGFTTRDIKKAGIDIQAKFKNDMTKQDFERLLEEYQPTSLWGIDLKQRGIPKGWNEVGGLVHVRKSLLQTLQWPAKVSVIFLKRIILLDS